MEKKYLIQNGVLILKKENSRSALRSKPALAAKWFTPNPGEDYFKIYAPVSKYANFRFVLTLYVRIGWL